MRRVIFITLVLTAVTGWGIPCHQRVLQAAWNFDALTELASRLNIGPAQLEFFLESPELAQRVQSLLVARFLIDERGPEILTELYWRAEGSTKYSTRANGVLRFVEWVGKFRFWSPFYRDREFMFADSLRALGETMPPTMLDSFNVACARVEEPGFLRGLAALRKDLGNEVRLFSETNIDKLRDEVAAHKTNVKKSFLSQIVAGSFSKPLRPPQIKPVHVQRAIEFEISAFLETIDFVPARAKKLEEKLDAYLEASLAKMPQISKAVRRLILDLQFENSPASFEEFETWMEARFEKIIETERRRLIRAWNNRPRPLPPTPTDLPLVSDPVATQTLQAEPEENIEDSGELDELEVFWKSTAEVAPKPAKNQPKRLNRRRSGAQVDAATEKQTEGFLVVLSESARKELGVLMRSPRLEGQIKKTLNLLAADPQHPGLSSHIHHGATNARADGVKVWRSSINASRGGYRIHWIYAPEERTIQVIEIVHHDGGER